MKKGNKKIIELDSPIDYQKLTCVINDFFEKYNFISIGYLGKSILGRDIPIIKLGDGKSKVIYISAHHGSEWITTGVMLRFINEYCELYKSCGNVEGIRIETLYKNVEINIVPMLNPDGVDLAINGLSNDNVLYERLISMNGGQSDFSHWNANGRGVDLNHNYNFGFSEYKKIESEQGIQNGAPTRFSGEYPESEPETGYLCNYIRFQNDFCGAISLHSQGEEIYYKCGEYIPEKSESIVKYFAGLCGYTLKTAQGMAAYGGFTEWFIREFDRPSFTFECGKGINPLPIKDLSMIYLKLRKILFEAPLILSRLRY
ncbi:MAG: M14 family metallocarboxypeptidase [Clostridia bacterium]|nr:M14 family metallocarboxypeptidase [Clostridia bacterium]